MSNPRPRWTDKRLNRLKYMPDYVWEYKKFACYDIFRVNADGKRVKLYENELGIMCANEAVLCLFLQACERFSWVKVTVFAHEGGKEINQLFVHTDCYSNKAFEEGKYTINSRRKEYIFPPTEKCKCIVCGKESN